MPEEKHLLRKIRNCYPRGKAYQRIMAIESMARTVKFKALQEKISQREASNAGN